MTCDTNITGVEKLGEMEKKTEQIVGETQESDELVIEESLRWVNVISGNLFRVSQTGSDTQDVSE